MKSSINLSKALALIFSVAAILLTVPHFAEMTPAQGNPNFDSGEVHVLLVKGHVYMLVGAGGNITFSVGDDGILLVDAGVAKQSDKVLAAIRQVSNKPIRRIVNTNIDLDHTGGNERISKAGERLDPGPRTGYGAQVFANLNVLTRMSAPTGKTPPVPIGLWPTDTFAGSRDFYFNDEGVLLIHQPAAHTDGDIIVHFRGSDVISTGDIFVKTSYPVIDIEKGGSIKGVIDGLNQIIAITIPKEKQEGGTMVIPGHGRLCDEADVVEYRDMMTIIRDRIQDMIQRGMTLQQVKAARPTVDYDTQYGLKTPNWTTDMFVEAAYRSLTQNK